VKDRASAGAVIYAKDVDRLVSFYSAVLELRAVDRHDDYTVLEAPGLQLVFLHTPPHIASTIVISVPPQRRANAAMKLVFFVPSIAKVRASAGECGGALNPTDKEWLFQGHKVCDGLDPEGNVIQFREHAR
jgi:catechol 2,3-dioxygenase-like lactoylglutathione lyase family enzyme